MTYTPGPWQSVATKHRTLINSIEGYRVAECDSLSEADAALIAAAPDLLAALKDLEWAVDGIAYVQDEYAEQVAKARAAIAKATRGDE